MKLWIAKYGKFGAVAGALILLALASGCHRQQRLRERPEPVRIAVVDFDVPKIFNTTKEIRGWWFGAHDIYRNPNAGEDFADVLARRLRQNASVAVYSRKDLQAYMLMQHSRVKRTYPDVSEGEIQELLEQVEPWEWGKDLGVDKVITGKLYVCRTVHNRTIHWWYSTVEAEVEVVDVATGSIDWKARMRCTRHLASQQRAQERLANRVVRQLKKRHLLE